MSARMDRIKARNKDRAEARKLEGGEWKRRGECVRCGACCDARNLNPESYREQAALYLEKRGVILSSICGNYERLEDGQLGCKIHRVVHVPRRRSDYPPGCASFPDSVEQWRLVMATCGYWFEWVEDGPRAAGKTRRARA